MILCIFSNLVTNLQTVNLCMIVHRKQTPIHVAAACMFFCRLAFFAFSTAGYIIMFESFCVKGVVDSSSSCAVEQQKLCHACFVFVFVPFCPTVLLGLHISKA